MQVIHPADNFRLTIEFNKDECEALAAVCGRIGGDAAGGRGTFDALRSILLDAGIKADKSLIDESRGCKGEIYFK